MGQSYISKMHLSLKCESKIVERIVRQMKGIPERKRIFIGEAQELPLFVFPSLEQTGIVKHGFTTRLGGVSEGIFATLNLIFT